MVKLTRVLRLSTVVCVAAAVVILAAAPAGAHDGGADGVWHPLTGVGHLLMIAGVGVLAVALLALGRFGRQRWATRAGLGAAAVAAVLLAG